MGERALALALYALGSRGRGSRSPPRFDRAARRRGPRQSESSRTPAPADNVIASRSSLLRDAARPAASRCWRLQPPRRHACPHPRPAGAQASVPVRQPRPAVPGAALASRGRGIRVPDAQRPGARLDGGATGVKRLLALIPPRGAHLTRFHGAFSAHSKLRRTWFASPRRSLRPRLPRTRRARARRSPARRRRSGARGWTGLSCSVTPSRRTSGNAPAAEGAASWPSSRDAPRWRRCFTTSGWVPRALSSPPASPRHKRAWRSDRPRGNAKWHPPRDGAASSRAHRLRSPSYRPRQLAARTRRPNIGRVWCWRPSTIRRIVPPHDSSALVLGWPP